MEVKDLLIKLRKKKKLSIEELSKEINISEKTLLNLEQGKITPNIQHLKRISEYYDIPMYKFISEKDIVNDLIKEKKYNILKLIIIFILMITVLILSSIFIHREKYQEMDIYSFNGESTNFKFKNGLVVLSKDDKFIEISKFDIKNDLELKSATINIAFNESIWYVEDYSYDEDGDFKEWFKDIYISEYSKKAGLLDSKDKEDSFSKYETFFPHDFKVEINYCTKKNICTVEILNIEASKLNTSNNEKK